MRRSPFAHAETGLVGSTHTQQSAPSRNNTPAKYSGALQFENVRTTAATRIGLRIAPTCPDVFIAALTAPERQPPMSRRSRAQAAAESVHATPASRDRIDADDAIQIFLNPFNDGRQALVFGVNPLGIQADGALVEGAGNRGASAFSALESGRESTDLTPDYIHESKGRVTRDGYEIEIAANLDRHLHARRYWRHHRPNLGYMPDNNST